MSEAWEKRYGRISWWWMCKTTKTHTFIRGSAKQALLDGVPVEPWAVDPVKHIYEGIFRPSSWPPVLCAGDSFLGHQAMLAWERGEFDLQSYRTIKEPA